MTLHVNKSRCHLIPSLHCQGLVLNIKSASIGHKKAECNIDTYQVQPLDKNHTAGDMSLHSSFSKDTCQINVVSYCNTGFLDIDLLLFLCAVATTSLCSSHLIEFLTDSVGSGEYLTYKCDLKSKST